MNTPVTFLTVFCILATVALADDTPPRGNQQDQNSTQAPLTDRETLLQENERLADLLSEQDIAGDFKGYIQTSTAQESVLRKLVSFAELEATVTSVLADVLARRADKYWLNSKPSMAKRTAVECVDWLTTRFGGDHWRTKSAVAHLDYFDKVAAADEPIQNRIISLELEYRSSMASGDYQAAVEAMKQLQAIETQVIGDSHPFSANTNIGLADAHGNSGDNGKALQEWKAAYKIRLQSYGARHPDTIACLHSLASIARSERQWDKAREHSLATITSNRLLDSAYVPDNLLAWIDDFGADTSEHYSVKGPVLFAEHSIRMPKGAAIGQRPDTGYAWSWSADIATQAADDTHFSLALTVTDSAFNPYVVEWKRVKVDGMQSTNVSFSRYKKGFFRYTSELLKEVTIPQDIDGKLTISWTYGQLVAEVNGKRVLTFFADAGGDTVAWSFKNLGPEIQLRELSWMGVEPIANADGLTETEKQESRQGIEKAMQLQQFGRFEEAIQLFETHLEKDITLVGKTHPEVGTLRGHLANCYGQVGDYTNEHKQMVLAGRILESALGGDHPIYVSLRVSMGMTLLDQQLYGDAAEFFKHAIQYYEGRDELLKDLTIALDGLGGAKVQMNDFSGGMELHQRSIDIRRRLMGPDSFELAASIFNLGLAYGEQRRLQESLELMKQAAAIFEQHFPDHPATGKAYTSIAKCYEWLQNADLASKYNQKATLFYRDTLGESHPDSVRHFRNVSLFEFRHGDRDFSQRLANSAFRSAIDLLERAAPFQTETQHFDARREVANCLSTLMTVTSNGDNLNYYSDVIRSKGLVTRRHLMSRQALRDSPLFEEYRLAVQKLMKLVNNATPAISANEDVATTRQRHDEWEAAVTESRDECGRIEQLLAEQFRDLNGFSGSSQIRASDVANMLREQQQPTAIIDLIEYFWFSGKDGDDEFRLAAFVITGDGAVSRVELGSANDIHKELARWRRDFGTSSEGREAGSNLRKLVWMPLEEKLKGIANVVVCPDGQATLIPWAALPGSAPDTFLLEEYCISVIPSTGLLAAQMSDNHNPDSSASKYGLLIAADIDYGNGAEELKLNGSALGSRQYFSRLLYSELEAQHVRQIFSRARPDDALTLLSGKSVTEEALSEHSSRSRWVHISTHATMSPSVKSNALGGIGARLSVRQGSVLVTQIVSGGAADRDGRLSAGDTIVSVGEADGDLVKVEGLELREVVGLLVGKPGTEVVLTISSPDTDSVERKLALIRRPLPSANDPRILGRLALSGANNTQSESGTGDGVLSAYELMTYDLSGVEVLALSACETALGVDAPSEGLLGLQHAGHVAGAKTVVSSLWEVDDYATSLLMTEFWRNVWVEKLSKAEALRRAQIYVMRHPKEVLAGANKSTTKGSLPGGLVIDSREQLKDARKNGITPPYYWGGFTLSGDWRQIQ